MSLSDVSDLAVSSSIVPSGGLTSNVLDGFISYGVFVLYCIITMPGNDNCNFGDKPSFKHAILHSMYSSGCPVGSSSNQTKCNTQPYNVMSASVLVNTGRHMPCSFSLSLLPDYFYGPAIPDSNLCPQSTLSAWPWMVPVDTPLAGV